MRWRHLRHLALAGLAAALVAPLLAATRPGAAPPLFSAGLLGNDLTLLPVTPAEAKGAAYLPGSNVLRLADGGYRYLPPGATEPVTVPAATTGKLDAAREPGGAKDAAGGSWGARDAARVSLGVRDTAGPEGAGGGPGPDLGSGLDLGRGLPVPTDPGVLAAVAADRGWLASGVVPGRTEAQRGAAAPVFVAIPCDCCHEPILCWRCDTNNRSTRPANQNARSTSRKRSNRCLPRDERSSTVPIEPVFDAG